MHDRVTPVPGYDDAEEVSPDSETRKRTASQPDEGPEKESEYLSALGSDAIFASAIPASDLKLLALDSTAGFLLSLLDGRTSVEEVLDIAGMPRVDALRHLRDLMDQGVIAPRLSPHQSSMPAPRATRPPAPSAPHSTCGGHAAGVPPLRMALADRDSIPVLIPGPDDLEAIDLSPEARMLVPWIDGKTTVEQILATAKMDLVAGTALFEQLGDDGLVMFL